MDQPDIKIHDLHPDLQPFFKPSGLLIVDHPLLRMSFASAAKINEECKRRLDSVHEFLRAKKWEPLLESFEAPYELLVFSVISGQMADVEYWRNLRIVWMSTENPFQQLGTCVRLFSSTRACRGALMSEEDKATFDDLPETLTIYRGYNPKFQNQKGISWTLKKDIAQRLGSRRGRYMANEEADIREETAKKEDIIAFMNLREEEEIIYLRDFPDEVAKNHARTEVFLAVVKNCLSI